jgi:hypothetical protein
MSEDDLKEWQAKNDEKRKARGGGGMKKVNDMLEGMGMSMVTEDEVEEQEKEKKQKKQKKLEPKPDFSKHDEL